MEMVLLVVASCFRLKMGGSLFLRRIGESMQRRNGPSRVGAETLVSHDFLPSLSPLMLNPVCALLVADGWVYTNDSWLDARSKPYMNQTSQIGDIKSRLKTVSVTRRRRWVRRIYYVGEVGGEAAGNAVTPG
jgi:hypothetical protein